MSQERRERSLSQETDNLTHTQSKSSLALILLGLTIPLVNTIKKRLPRPLGEYDAPKKAG